MTHYNNYQKYFVAVDCIIMIYNEVELCVMLYSHNFKPSTGAWSFMGGFIYENESSYDAAKRVLKQTNGHDNIFLEPVKTFTNPQRESGSRVISIAYFDVIRMDQYDKMLVCDHGAYWWPLSELAELIFDHREMVAIVLERLQYEASYKLNGHELLGDRFTFWQLRKLYEAIFQHKLEPRNLRKKYCH